LTRDFGSEVGVCASGTPLLGLFLKPGAALSFLMGVTRCDGRGSPGGRAAWRGEGEGSESEKGGSSSSSLLADPSSEVDSGLHSPCTSTAWAWVSLDVDVAAGANVRDEGGDPSGVRRPDELASESESDSS